MQQMIEVYSKMIFIMLKREKLNENYHHLLKFKKRKYLLLVKTIKIFYWQMKLGQPGFIQRVFSP